MSATKVHDTLYVGDLGECELRSTKGSRWAAVLHAAKDPCHRLAVDYQGAKSLGPSHPEYLWALRGDTKNQLVLNLVDPPVPLFKAESFTVALDFLDAWVPQGDVLIHCSQGWSRAPSLALTWLAKRAGVLPDTSYGEAYQKFLELYPAYVPGAGISTFLRGAWGAIR